MTDSFISVMEGRSSETEIKKSVFFCHLKMTRTVDEADQFIKDMKQVYKGYTNASAYIVGNSGEKQKARDNGEPSGTAGLPILEALKKHKLVNATAVVSRKWGGTLLGANRLKIYYGGAVDKALAELGQAEWRLQQEVSVIADYRFQAIMEKNLNKSNWINLKDIKYAEKVTFQCSLDLSDLEQFKSETADWLNGSGEYLLGDQNYLPYKINP